MPAIDVVVKSSVDLSIKARQVCGMFDCPPQDKQQLSWKVDLPIESRQWSVGLIVGPSGCGKSTIAKHLWPDAMSWEPKFDGATVIDCFDGSIEQVTGALGAVGFNTIPAWIRPYHVLSNGEKFRVEVAKRILHQPGIIVIDEFTSVVDRQVATVASHAVQKYVRKAGRQLVAVGCHYDVIDWLQPDWVFEPATLEFNWRSLRQRPQLSIEVARVPYEAWKLFAPYHYMSAQLNKSAKCYGLWVNGSLAAFAGVLHFPHAIRRDIKSVSRVVCLPDFQGLGLGFVLIETLGSAYKTLGFELRNYPAHPSFIRAHRPSHWSLKKKPGIFSPANGKTSARKDHSKSRPCAVFAYCGPSIGKDDAHRLLGQ